MTSSIDTVTDSINDTTTSRTFRSITCSSYIELVTNFTSIADTLSELENIESLSSEIENSDVSACSTTELESLSSLQSSLDTIRTELEEIIEYLQSLLHSTIGPSTSDLPSTLTSMTSSDGKSFIFSFLFKTHLYTLQFLQL